MRVWEIQAFGSGGLAQTDRDATEPGPGEIAIRMRAFSLNYRDVLVTRGSYNPRQPLPLVPCSDGVGEVVAVGAGVTRFAVGDRASPIFVQGWLGGRPDAGVGRTALGSPLDGVLQEVMVVGEQAAVRPPEHLSDVEAAALPCAAVTAWSALAGVRAGDTVLTLGTGGVSLFALQLARLAGARVGITSSSDAKLERARALGAAWTCNYRSEPGWGKAARRWAGDGVDYVIEVGGAGTLAQSLQAVRVAGTVALIGVLAGGKTEVSLTSVLMRGIRVQGVFVGSRDDHEAVCRALAAHPETRPVADRTFGWDEVPQALDYLASGAHFGKVTVSAGRG